MIFKKLANIKFIMLLLVLIISIPVSANSTVGLLGVFKGEGSIMLLPKLQGYVYLPKDKPIIKGYNLDRKEIWEYQDQGYAGATAIHPSGKYIAVVFSPPYYLERPSKLVLLNDKGQVIWEQVGDAGEILFAENKIATIDKMNEEIVRLYDLTGKILWEETAGSVLDMSRDGNRILIDGKVLNLEGKEIWETRTEFMGKMAPSGETVIAVPYLNKINYVTEGRNVWSQEVPTGIREVFCDYYATQILVHTEKEEILSLDKNGEKIWTWTQPSNAQGNLSIDVNFEEGVIVVGINASEKNEMNLFVLDMQGQTLYSSKVSSRGDEIKVSLAPDGRSFVASLGQEHFVYKIN